MSTGAGRRAARPSRSLPKLPVGSSAVAAAMAVVAALLVFLAPSAPGDAARPAGATGARVQQTTLGCPRLLAAPGDAKTSYAAGLAAVEGLGTDGTVTPAVTRGSVAQAGAGTETGLVVTGEGGSAQGLFAWRADTGPSTVAVTPCPQPRASWWFTGAGAGIDHESTLTLANLDTGPAVVDVTVLTPDGQADVSATGGTGIAVQPGERVNISLVQLVPQAEEVAVWVHAARGRVVAGMSDRFASSAGAKAGHEWLPAQIQPARAVRLSGLPVGARSRTLLVANPSELESLVAVEVSGKNGRFIPAGLGELSVPPGTVASVDLSQVLPGEVYAVRLRAERPVVATVRSVMESDVAYAGAAQPILEAAALPVVGTSTVQLTGGNETSRVDATAYNAAGKSVGTTRVSLAAHATGTWPVPAGAAYVVLVPAQGNAYGSMVYAGKLASAVPFEDLPLSIRIPAVRPAL